jgi:zinc transporter 11
VYTSSLQRKILDGSLGFAAGVMLAASYWSLLAPAIELANRSGIYGRYTFLPISLGFAAGAAFIYATDLLLPLLGVVVLEKREEEENRGGWARRRADSASSVEEGETGADYQYRSSTGSLRHRARDSPSPRPTGELEGHPTRKSSEMTSWRRILLLIIAITVHNIPEGLAVGVGFGAIGKTPSATLESARNLAIGIGIQNFPEGLAVSLPLRAAGMGVWKSLWYGQLSGMVEPLAGLFGTIAVVVAEPLLPYALSFAAGAMVYVVLDDLVPEANQCGNGKLSSVAAVFGFIVMMSLDVGLG